MSRLSLSLSLSLFLSLPGGVPFCAAHPAVADPAHQKVSLSLSLSMATSRPGAKRLCLSPLLSPFPYAVSDCLLHRHYSSSSSSRRSSFTSTSPLSSSNVADASTAFCCLEMSSKEPKRGRGIAASAGSSRCNAAAAREGFVAHNREKYLSPYQQQHKRKLACMVCRCCF